MKERVQKIIAQSGMCSRRKAEELIEAGKVCVNGKPITLGDKADEQKDHITVNDMEIVKEEKVYYMLHKPKDYVTSPKDPYNKKSVLDLVPKHPRVFSVGRLDKDSTGLVILTNDGDFANTIMHPRNEIKKTYIAILKKPFNPKDLDKFSQGVVIDNKKVRAQAVSLTKNTLAITLHVGIHKVVKRLCKEIGYYVKKLHRTHIGNLALDVDVGMFRELDVQDKKEVMKKPSISKKTFVQHK